MHWFALALLALVVGFLVGPINSWIASMIPASSASSNAWVKALINGAIILGVVFISVFLLSVIGVKESKV